MDVGCVDYNPVSVPKIRMNYQSYCTFPMETAVTSHKAVEVVTLLCSLIRTFVYNFSYVCNIGFIFETKLEVCSYWLYNL